MTTTEKPNLFRKEALDRLSSPERLDQLMQVVQPKKWIPLTAMGSLIAIGLAWSVFGRIPITVAGQGVIVFPSKVTPFQSPSSGQIVAINIRVGDTVKKGQVIATISQTELQEKLQLARSKLAQLQEQDRAAKLLQLQRQDVDSNTIQQQRQALEQSLTATQSVTPILREKGLEAIQRDRQNLEERLQTTRELLPTFQKRFANREDLLRQGAVSADAVLQARQDVLSAQTRISEAESQLKQLDVKEADAQRQFLENLNSAKNLEAQLQALDSKTATQAEQDLSITTNRKKEIQDTERLITELSSQIKGKSQVISNYSGRVLEVTAIPGQNLQENDRIGTIEAQDASSRLMSVAYLPVSEGKKVQKDMEIQVTPSTVKRERFGGIVAKVASVSEFPVTKESAANVIGGAELLQSLTEKGPQIQVIAELQPDPNTKSGLRWSSSKGPEEQVTSGITTSVRITIEEQAPIAFVFPILRSWSGVY